MIQKNIELNFQFLNQEIQKESLKSESLFKELKDDIREIREEIREIRRDISRIDKEVGIITATLRFNGFDLDRHEVEGE